MIWTVVMVWVVLGILINLVIQPIWSWAEIFLSAPLWPVVLFIELRGSMLGHIEATEYRELMAACWIRRGLRIPVGSKVVMEFGPQRGMVATISGVRPHDDWGFLFKLTFAPDVFVAPENEWQPSFMFCVNEEVTR